MSFLESEILRKSGKTYNLSEMFIANKNYMDRAVKKSIWPNIAPNHNPST